MNQAELGAFLRSRRERLRPEDVGVVGGGRRRTPGLRREEVALLASISTDYYERLEQGRGPRPSPAALTALARALRLTPDQRDHLFLLAGQAAPPAPRVSSAPDPSLSCVLDALAPTVPAMIVDDLFHILVQNPLNIALVGPLAASGGRLNNFLWRWFTDAEWSSMYLAEQRETLGSYYVADLRASVARRGGDGLALSLVDDLREASAEFRRLWERRDVAVKRSTGKVILHPHVGRLDLHCDNVASPPSGQRLVLFRPKPGTDAADRLAKLAIPVASD